MPEIVIGKITGIFTTNKNREPFKTAKGKPYRKILIELEDERKTSGLEFDWNKPAVLAATQNGHVTKDEQIAVRVAEKNGYLNVEEWVPWADVQEMQRGQDIGNPVQDDGKTVDEEDQLPF